MILRKYYDCAHAQEVSQPQLRELIMNYEPEVIYADGEWDADYTYWNSTEFLAWLYNDRCIFYSYLDLATKIMLTHT